MEDVVAGLVGVGRHGIAADLPGRATQAARRDVVTSATERRPSGAQSGSERRVLGQQAKDSGKLCRTRLYLFLPVCLFTDACYKSGAVV